MLEDLFAVVQEQTDKEKVFGDLIEIAYLEAQIDGEQQLLAFLWLRASDWDKEH